MPDFVLRSEGTFGRRSIGGRRRSSGVGFGRRMSGFGGGTPVDSAEQAKLADMYSQIIKLSSENKINAKNSWSLNLIEHMDRMILSEAGGRNRVNFQKASCTLDASIKIYSYRVDETAASTYRVLENLNRTGDAPRGGGAADGADSAGGSDGDGGGGAAAKGRRAARSKAASKLCLADTLEKSAAALNISELDRECAVDPLFRKMAQTFDEAGSRGMLLLNLGVADGCSVTFGGGGADEQDGAGEEGAEAAAAAAAAATLNEGGVSEERGAPAPVDVSGLRAKLLQMCADLGAVPLCPQYEEIRQELRKLGEPMAAAAAAAGGGGGAEASGPSPSASPGASAAAADNDGGADASFDFGGGGDSYAGGGDSDNDDDGGGGGADYEPDAAGRASFGSVFAPDAEVVWGDAAGGGGGGGGGGRRLSTSVVSHAAPILMDRLCRDVKASAAARSGVAHSRAAALASSVLSDFGAAAAAPMVEDEYAYFDRAALAAANQWAGHTHWKFASTRGKTAGGEGETKKAGAKRPRKAAFSIDFNAPPVPASVFAPAKPRAAAKGAKQKAAPAADATQLSAATLQRALRPAAPAADATQLSAATLQRAAAAAEAGALTLPKDLHFRARDLGRLFLRPAAVAHDCAEEGATVNAFNVDGVDFAGGSGGGGGDDDYDGGGYDGYSDDDGGGGFSFGGGSSVTAGASIGALIDDDFDSAKLLKADRVVEKVEVKYATRAKKVDVRRLKHNLWQHIDAVVPPPLPHGVSPLRTAPATPQSAAAAAAAGDGATGGAAQPEPEPLLFSSVLDEVSSKEDQSGVTVSYYFICLLHLANEKGLRLEGQDDLMDFGIGAAAH
ncbi:condensin complex subunit 2-domain-containing protein [Tribonema minus]|uniref:Condensin complex subunit 2 n=1 Tax=Tribonema minus TaxID=303371 RepID=A0A835Z1S3_9STRA|nr:condensin complex subunit 2-domain-containing protein [Tribonema minus]